MLYSVALHVVLYFVDYSHFLVKLFLHFVHCDKIMTHFHFLSLPLHPTKKLLNHFNCRF